MSNSRPITFRFDVVIRDAIGVPIFQIHHERFARRFDDRTIPRHDPTDDIITAFSIVIIIIIPIVVVVVVVVAVAVFIEMTKEYTFFNGTTATSKR